MFDKDNFPPCPICNARLWEVQYTGSIREGSNVGKKKSCVAKCGKCKVQRLAEHSCVREEMYSGAGYRTHLGQSHDPASYYDKHDHLMNFALRLVETNRLRGKIVADIGCAGGALLDQVSGLAKTTIGIDPDFLWEDTIKNGRHIYFQSIRTASNDFGGLVDFAFSNQVIEHVVDPVDFLSEIYSLLADDGIAVIGTPNGDDILLEALPDIFPQFFYRDQHRWIFDRTSIAKCSEAAKFADAEIHYVHRYNFANFVEWLRSGAPKGNLNISVFDSVMDDMWRTWVQYKGVSDNLFAVMKKSVK